MLAMFMAGIYRVVCDPNSASIGIGVQLLALSCYRVFLIQRENYVCLQFCVPPYRRMEDRIRTLCQRLIDSDENSDDFRATSAELQAALSKHIGQMRSRLKTYALPTRGDSRNSELAEELNTLLDEQKKPVKPPPE